MIHMTIKIQKFITFSFSMYFKKLKCFSAAQECLMVLLPIRAFKKCKNYDRSDTNVERGTFKFLNGK